MGEAMRAEPGYLRLLDDGELSRRAALAGERLADCDLCARACGVDRTRALEGSACQTGARASVTSFGPHHGEEAPLSGWAGSGTIFFDRCNLRCVFCQNSDISQASAGRELEPEELAAVMLALQERGCHNVNLVSPSHVVAPVLAAVHLAAERGLRLPIVYNTGGYDCLPTLALLDGIVDVYMPDLKYGDSRIGRRLSGVDDYVEVNRAAVLEMHRQVGDLELDERGIARRGLLVRHLVLPGGLAGTEEVLAFLAEEVSPDTYVNVMDQYHPCYRARDHEPLDRRLSREEWREALRIAGRAGLRRLDHRAGRLG